MMTSYLRSAFLVSIILVSVLGATGQTVTMVPNTTIYDTSDGIFFYDSGGPLNNYQNSENSVVVFCPYPDVAPYHKTQTLEGPPFSSFDIETNNDWLYIFDGPDTLSPLIAQCTGLYMPSYLGSSHPTGCLTVQFKSNSILVRPGWELFVFSDSGIVNLDELGKIDAIQLSPNPTRGPVEVVGEFQYYSVLDATGKELFTSKQHTFDLNEYPNGVYFVKLETPLGETVRKLIKL